MKPLKNPLLLILTWLISIFALTLSFLFYEARSNVIGDAGKMLGSTFLLMIYAGVFSFPAFLFFITISTFILRNKNWSNRKKRVLMMGTNMVDILFTFGVFVIIIFNDFKMGSSATVMNKTSELFFFYPFWILVLVSNLLILTLPYHFHKTNSL